MTKLRRRIGLDGNPLRRTEDRIEGWATIALLAVLLLAGPALSWWVGSTVYHGGVTAEHAARGSHPTAAVLVADAPFPAANYAAVTVPTVVAPARWKTTDGTVHSGLVPVRAGVPAGTPVTVWTDSHGAPVAAPQSHGETTSRAVLAALGAPLGLALLLGAAWLAVRRTLDRRRLAAWQAAWAMVGPRWTGRP